MLCRNSCSTSSAIRSVRDDDEVGPPERMGGLPQQSARQQSAIAPRLQRVDEYDVQVTVKPTMLEGVVEDDDLGLWVDGFLSRLPSSPFRGGEG